MKTQVEDKISGIKDIVWTHPRIYLVEPSSDFKNVSLFDPNKFPLL